MFPLDEVILSFRRHCWLGSVSFLAGVLQSSHINAALPTPPSRSGNPLRQSQRTFCGDSRVSFHRRERDAKRDTALFSLYFCQTDQIVLVVVVKSLHDIATGAANLPTVSCCVWRHASARFLIRQAPGNDACLHPSS
jgi:hypothetical protein